MNGLTYRRQTTMGTTMSDLIQATANATGSGNSSAAVAIVGANSQHGHHNQQQAQQQQHNHQQQRHQQQPQQHNHHHQQHHNSQVFLPQDGAPYPISSVSTIPEAQLDSIVNVTREYPFDYAIVMFGYLLPIVLFVTIVTNLLVVAVLYQRHMRTPTNIVLFTMAIVDLATLLSPSPWYLYIYTFGNHNKFLYPPIACYAHHIMTDVVPVFFHTSSIWLALLLASQRYIYVCHPTLARTWCTVPRVKRAILVILAIAFLHQLTRFFDNSFVSVQVEYNNAKNLACKNEIAEWVHSIDVAFYYTTYFTFRILFVFIIPCSALITLNWLLFRALKRAETKRTQLLKTRFKIVGVDPSQSTGQKRNSQHNNLSMSAFGLVGGVRATSSFAPPSTATGAISQRGATIMDDRLINDDEEEEEDDDDEDDAPDCGNLVEERKSIGMAKTAACLSSENEDPIGDKAKIKREESLTGKENGTVETTELQYRRRSSATKMRSGSDAAEPVVATTTNTRGGSLRSGSSASSNSSASSSSAGASNSAGTSRSSASASKTDDLFTCPECAAFEAEVRRACRHCSSSLAMPGEDGTGSTTLASCDHHRQVYHRHLLHQPISQCSSILGGATTTNEEDISSCLATQNMSTSMLVPTNIDCIETSSMRWAEDEEEDEVGVEEEEDDDVVGQGEELPLDCNGCGDNELDRLEAGSPSTTRVGLASRRKQVLANRLARLRANQNLSGLIKSGSVDNRLDLGRPENKASKVRRVRSLGKPGQQVAQLAQRERIASDNQAQEKQTVATNHINDASTRRDSSVARVCRDVSSGDGRYGRAEVVACSRSAHSICGTPELARLRTSNSLLLSGDKDLEKRQRMSIDSGWLSTGKLMRKQGHEIDSRPNGCGNHFSRSDLHSTNATVQGYQPATTTTTLYSANTSSVSSLAQLQGGATDGAGKLAPGQANDDKSQLYDGGQSRPQNLIAGNENQSTPNNATNGDQTLRSTAISQPRPTKSPSFASYVTGRSSRATLLGGPNSTPINQMPMIVSGAQNNIQATIPVSARSMDSNRTTLMLVVVVTVFLFVEVPVALMTIAHVVLNTFNVFKDVQFDPCLAYIKLFTNFMIMISYSVNFTIYCSMSKRFRETFRDLFNCGRSGQRKRTKRIFSQSQAPHYTPQTTNPHQFAPVSTLVTGVTNHQNNNNLTNHQHGYNNYLSPAVSRPSKQLGGGGELGLTGSNSKQNLLSGQNGPRKSPTDQLQSECEL